MKYVISWETRSGITEEAVARSLQVFSKWSPTEPGNFKEFLGRLDGNGGFAVVETDDPTLIAKDAATFTPWFDFEVHPVLEIADIAMIDATALEFIASVE